MAGWTGFERADTGFAGAWQNQARFDGIKGFGPLGLLPIALCGARLLKPAPLERRVAASQSQAIG